MKELELYLHIPFCVSKCKYCDFLSAPSRAEERQNYVESLCQKIRSYREFAEAYHVVSIFLGGGTPSLLSGEQVTDIFCALRETFFILENAEITMEMNPGTVTEEKLKAYRCVGVNRLSIGLQSTDNRELKLLGRIHTYEEFLHTWELVRREGFLNVNIDLMFAIPFQTLESYEKTLRTVAELGPEHISAYSLIMEEGTPFYERYGEGRHAEELPSEEEERLMYEQTSQILETYGYQRYEISNYAKDGYACRHNLGYWDRVEYLGIGAGASSFIGNRRWVEGEEEEVLDEQAQKEEFMFLGLRKTEGVSKTKFQRCFARELLEVYGDTVERLTGQGLLIQEGDKIRLSARGLDLANYVMSEFLL